MTAALSFSLLGAVIAVGVYGAIQHARTNRRMNHVANRVQWVEGELQKMQRPQLTLIRGGKK